MKKINLEKFRKELNKQYDPNSPIMFHLKYSEVMNACREIRVSSGAGSGFIFKYKNKNFLVTAAHVVKDKRRVSKRKVSLTQFDGTLYTFNGEIFYHENKECDVCVIKLPDDYIAISVLEYQYQQIVVGEEYFYFGYPGSVDTSLAITPIKGSGTPISVIRRGIISTFNEQDDIHYMLVDSLATAGFSGSPLVGFDKKGNSFVIGVINSSNMEAENIVDQHENEQELWSVAHTGLTEATHILYVIDIIENHELYL